MKDIYLQFLDNYFLEKKSTITRLVNPDYYARLGGSLFYTLLTHFRKSNDDIRNLLLFILEWEFGKDRLGVNPQTNATMPPQNPFSSKKTKKKQVGGEGGEEGGVGGGVHSRDDSEHGVVGGVGGGGSSGWSGGGSGRSMRVNQLRTSWVMDDLVSQWVLNFKSDKSDTSEAKYLIITQDGIVLRR